MNAIEPFRDTLARAGFAPERPDDRTTVRFMRDGRMHVLTLATSATNDVNVHVSWRLPEAADERDRLRAANLTNCFFSGGKVVLDATYRSVAFSVCRTYRTAEALAPDLVEICKLLDLMASFFFATFSAPDSDAQEHSGVVSFLRRPSSS